MNTELWKVAVPRRGISRRNSPEVQRIFEALRLHVAVPRRGISRRNSEQRALAVARAYLLQSPGGEFHGGTSTLSGAGWCS